MAFQRTLIILKPDAVARGLVSEIIGRFERKGMIIAGMKLMQITKALASRHYAEHKGKSFYNNLLKFITSGPVVVMAIEGNDAVATCRKMIGATSCLKAEPGTIRGDFGMSGCQNLVHGSDSPASAKREVALFFKSTELVKTSKESLRWVYDYASGQPR